MLVGGTPRPVQTTPTVQLDDVTYGYVPREGEGGREGEMEGGREGGRE